MRKRAPLLFAALVVVSSAIAVHAASGSKTVGSPMAGNGHNISFDGRVFVVRQGPGWMLTLLRPEQITYAPGGLPRLGAGAFSAPALIQAPDNGENALAICEADAGNTPYACDDAGDPGGPYACYDFWIVDSNAEGGQYNGLRRRRLKVWVANPSTATASLHRHQWMGGLEPVQAGGADLRGIEPTVTRDGRLLVWQGHPDNDGKIDILMYATNATPCAAGGWDGPHVISHMYADANVRGTYRLGERQLRAADGTPFADNQLVRGAYPWLFADGDALTFTAATMPCRATEDPPGCGPRRNALSVIGYPTNWGIAHIDGDVNPSTKDTVRLFFSSPGPVHFDQVPVTGGTDVWPFFGSNTSNYTELVFDDALDGRYAGVWHMNESVNTDGNLDLTRTPDTSGYFNTAIVNGARFPDANQAPFGKALVFDGDGDHIEVPHDASLDPINAMSIQMTLRLASAVDCDANNNYRVLLSKGDVASGAYSLVLEEGERIQARVRAGGQERALLSTRGLPVGQWVNLGMSYDGATGAMRLYIDAEPAGAADFPPGTLDGSSAPLRVGSPGGSRATCPNGDGAFAGDIDELAISRAVRDLTHAPLPGNDARFVMQEIPAQVEAGQPFFACVTLRNAGTTAWSDATMHRLGSEAPRDNARWGTGRVTLRDRALPGADVGILLELTAPSMLGTYDMQWQMVQDGAEWFGETTELASVEVVADGTLPDVPPPTCMTVPPMLPDGGMPNADAGPLPPGVDGGPLPPGVDGGPGIDAGTSEESPPEEGCGCHAAGRPSSAAWPLVLGLALLWKRRRR